MARTLFYIGLIFILGSLFWPWLSKLGFGYLPGDIHVKRDGYVLHVPVVSCILASIVLSVVMYILRKLRF